MTQDERSPTREHARRGRVVLHRDGGCKNALFGTAHDGDGYARAREELVKQYLPLAHKLARRYVRSSEPPDDLVQVASLGLLKAIDRFDPERGSGFTSFAIPTILGELRRHFRDTGWSVHVPRAAQERALAVEEAATDLTAANGAAPTVKAIADYLRLDAEQVIDGLIAARAYDTRSLDAPKSNQDDDGGTLIDDVGAVDERYELVEADLTVSKAVRCLPQRERRILHLRYVEDMTQSQIAARVGVSQMQVSRLLARSIGRLRELAGS